MLVDKVYIVSGVVCIILFLLLVWYSGVFSGENYGQYTSRWSYSWQDWEDPAWSDQHELSVIGGPPTTAECRRDKAGPDSIYLNLDSEAIKEAAADPEVASRVKLEPRKAVPLLRASIPSEVNYVEHLGACPADLIQKENAMRGRVGAPGRPSSAVLRMIKSAGVDKKILKDTKTAMSVPSTLKIDGAMDPVIIGDNGYVYKV